MEFSLCILENRGIKEVVEHVHMCEILWCVKGITNFERKEIQFTTTLQGYAHRFYKNFDPNQTCVDYAALKDAFLKEFYIPKFKQKSISVLKDINYETTESV